MVCGDCGLHCHSYRRYYKKTLLDGRKSIHHKVAYRCNRRVLQEQHARTSYRRCANPEISARIIEPLVWNIIGSVMVDPARIRLYMEPTTNNPRSSERRIRRQVKEVDRRLSLSKSRNNASSISTLRVSRGHHQGSEAGKKRDEALKQFGLAPNTMKAGWGLALDKVYDTLIAHLNEVSEVIEQSMQRVIRRQSRCVPCRALNSTSNSCRRQRAFEHRGYAPCSTPSAPCISNTTTILEASC